MRNHFALAALCLVLTASAARAELITLTCNGTDWGTQNWTTDLVLDADNSRVRIGTDYWVSASFTDDKISFSFRHNSCLNNHGEYDHACLFSASLNRYDLTYAEYREERHTPDLNYQCRKAGRSAGGGRQVLYKPGSVQSRPASALYDKPLAIPFRWD